MGQSMTHEKKSSFTANSQAQFRTLTNIPYAHEIAALLPNEGDILSHRAIKRVPLFEARYLLLDDELRRFNAKQFVELGAGMTPRGLILSQHACFHYIEVDLPAKSNEKRILIEKLEASGSITPRSNLHFVAGNVAHDFTFERVESLLGPEPVAVFNEGLLRYISFSDKEKLASNVHRLLKKHGGVWITMDIELAEHELATQKQRERYASFEIDVVPNLFQNESHATSFFKRFGFEVQVVPFKKIDVSRLASPSKIGLSRKEVLEMIEHRLAFVLKPL